MGDVAPVPATNAAPAEKPDVDALFAPKDVDDLFPADFKPTSQPVRNVSPVQDYLFSNPGRAHARILDAFGYGFNQNWGAATKEFSEADEALKKAGVFSDYEKGQRSIFKAANDVIMRPAVAAFFAGKGALGGAVHGVQSAITQAGEEYGAPNLARDIAGGIEAFPTGIHQPMGIPHEVPHVITEAKSLDTIGQGEAGYFGTRPVEPTTVAEAASAAKVEDTAAVHAGEATEAPPSPTVEPVAASPAVEAPAPDIHAVARQVAPDTFHEFDALAQKKDTFRRWIDELREVRDQAAAESAPHAAEIADLQQKLEGATPRNAKKYQARLDPLIAGRDAYLAEHTQGDSADMAKVRKQLMETDYRMRDLAPDVSKAYREAEGRMPQQNPEVERTTAQVSEEAKPAAEAAPAEQPIKMTETQPAPATSENTAATKTEQIATPSAAAEVARLPIAHAPSIVADVTQKLKAAGRPAEEADAAAQIVAAYWETRAQRFEGKKGTAAEMYARETPEIKAGKERGTKNERALEMAQEKRVNDLYQIKAFHGSPYDFDRFDLAKIGTGEGAQSFGHGLYFAENESVARSYRDDLEVTVGGAKYDMYNPLHVAVAQVEESGSRAAAIRDIRRAVERDRGDPSSHFANVLRFLESDRELPEFKNNSGRVYQVHIDVKPEDLLDWDKPLNQQTPGVQKAVKHAMGIDYHGKFDPAKSERLWSEFGRADTGRALRQGFIASDDKIVAKRLSEAGVPGIKYFDQDSRATQQGTRNFVLFDDGKIKITHKDGKPVTAADRAGIIQDLYQRQYGQEAKGRIRVRDEGRNTITLMKSADASTFIHETGHDWLDRMIRDAKDTNAPAPLKADSDTVLKWLGVDSVDAIKTKQHEKFARGFETYMMEGRAPSQALANVFARFKDWLTTIYRTVKALKSPISDDIRAVFDRLISEKPEKTVIAPEAAPARGGLSERHEGLVETTPPERAHEVANTIEAERDSHAGQNLLENADNDTRLKDTGAEAEGRAARGAQPSGHADASEPVGGEAGAPVGIGAERGGGSEVAAESSPARKESERVNRADSRAASEHGGAVAGAQSEVPGGTAARAGGESTRDHPLDANAPLPRPETRLIDKAGNIRLDNLGTPEDVSAVIRQTADELSPYNEAITRGVIPDAEVVKLADALGMDASKLSERKLGQAFNAEQIVAARKLLIQSATDVRDAMAKAAEGDEAAILAYAQAKSRHLMIQEQVSGITAEAGRALRAFRALEGQQEAAAIGAFLQDTTGKTLYQLQREAQLGLELETPQQVSKFVADSAKPSYKDMAIEAWMAALLSGPRTHVANILGNSIASIWHVVETAASSAVGAVLRSEDRVHLAEAGAEMFGMVQGSREGLVAARRAFLTGEPQLTSTLQTEKPHAKALPGAFGQAVRTPLRLLGAEDEFFKAVAFRGDIYRQAYVTAAKEGLAPELMRQRVAELSMAPTDAMIEAAKKVADYQTFQSALGKTGRAIQAVSNSHALAKIVVPFVRTPLNLLKYANERSPLGLFSQEVRDNLAGKNGTRARDTQIARITLGTMVGVTAFSLAAQGLITGGGPADKGKKSILQADGWQPYSVKVGDMYYSYNRLDPFSITMGVAADAYEILTAAGADHPDKEHLPALVLGAISKNVLNRASLSGLSDLLQAVSDPERYGKNYVKGLVGSVVPALAGQSAQTIDPTVREARNVIDTLKSRIPFVSQTLFPRRDVWGEPVVRGGALGPDVASPIAESRLKNDPVNRALLDAGFFPSTVERKIRGVDLTDQQFDDYGRLAGRMAKMQLNAFVNTPGLSTLPKQVRAEKMREIVNHARESARSMVLMQNPEIIKKANDAKKAKFTEGAPAH